MNAIIVLKGTHFLFLFDCVAAIFRHINSNKATYSVKSYSMCLNMHVAAKKSKPHGTNVVKIHIIIQCVYLQQPSGSRNNIFRSPSVSVLKSP